MYRNETFRMDDVDRIEASLAWASLEMIHDDIPSIQVMISGDENDVSDLRVELSGRKLSVSQPAYGISPKIISQHWMQVFIRIPAAWKGAITGYTTTAVLNARGLSGTDIHLETVTGDLRASSIDGIALVLRTISGRIQGEGLNGRTLSCRTVTGTVKLSGCAFQEYQLNGMSADQTIELSEGFTSMEGSTVSGDVSIFAPVQAAEITLRAVTGRLRVCGMENRRGDAPIRFTSVSGCLTVNSTLMNDGQQTDSEQV